MVDNILLEAYLPIFTSIFWYTRMHYSRMQWPYLLSRSCPPPPMHASLSCMSPYHARPSPPTYAPCHNPLTCMPPAMHTPCHACVKGRLIRLNFIGKTNRFKNPIKVALLTMSCISFIFHIFVHIADRNWFILYKFH